MKKRRLRLAFVAIVALGVAATVFAFSSRPGRMIRSAPPSVAVAINGKLAQLVVQDGDRVQQGQLIGYLDSSGYEADLAATQKQLKELETQTQEAIKPMEALPGIAGFLPRTVPQAQYVEVPAAQKAPVKLTKTIKTPVAKPAEGAYQVAQKDQQAKKDALDAATQELAKQTAAVADAQKARDALRPKVTQAGADAMQAEKKAAGSKDLLDQGAISAKRAEDLLADRDAANKAVAALNSQVDAADKALAEAQADQERARADVERASAALKSSDDALAKVADTPAPPAPRPAPPAAKPAPASKQQQPHQMSSKIVMRRMPLVARAEEAPAIPLKVFVDEKTMRSSQAKIAELQQRIETLKARIAECKVLAPAAGIVRVQPGGVVIERS